MSIADVKHKTKDDFLRVCVYDTRISEQIGDLKWNLE